MEVRILLFCVLFLSSVAVGRWPNNAAKAQSVTGGLAPASYAAPSALGAGEDRPPAAAPLSAEQARELEIIRQLARHRGGQPEALAQIIQLASPYGDATCAELLEELAVSHRRSGDLNLAAEARTHLAERYPNEPLARRSIIWLVRLYASGEVTHARRSESQGTANLRRQLSPRLADAASEASPSLEGAPAVSPSADKAGEQLSLYALHLATRAMSSDAGLADDPALAFQRSVAARRAGQMKSSQAFISPIKHRAAADPWGQCARAEEWLLDRESKAAPKLVMPCITAPSPPHLDGRLDDSCWLAEDAQLASLNSGNSEAPSTDVRLTYDDDYLYIALRCQKLVGADYQRDDQPRPRDGNVELHDRVRLLIDVDRDYASWFELVVDSRGWTTDGCWGDGAWNPQWFVARGESPDGAAWTAEAAIPLDELSAVPPARGVAWTCATTRLAPRETPVDDVSPSAFSLLLFE